jgi:hypothetical protein
MYTHKIRTADAMATVRIRISNTGTIALTNTKKDGNLRSNLPDDVATQLEGTSLDNTARSSKLCDAHIWASMAC